jgi:hypothetical protein
VRSGFFLPILRSKIPFTVPPTSAAKIHYVSGLQKIISSSNNKRLECAITARGNVA